MDFIKFLGISQISITISSRIEKLTKCTAKQEQIFKQQKISCVETQLSKLNFGGTYHIRNLANPTEVILQQARVVPQITLDLVKENFINIEFHNQIDYNEAEWINCFNVRTPYRNTGTQRWWSETIQQDLKQRTWQRLVDGDPFFIPNWRTLCFQWIKDSSDFIIRGDYGKWE